MKLSEIKNEGYDGLHVYCPHCRRMTEIPFRDLPDGEFVDVAKRLICSRCENRPNVTTYRDETKRMRY